MADLRPEPLEPCPACGHPLMVIGTHLLVLHSCTHCDLRWWEREGHRVAFAEALDHMPAAASGRAPVAERPTRRAPRHPRPSQAGRRWAEAWAHRVGQPV